mmetsp:Transcript_12547/g.23561  ORF Transcript_12547/g.23561 Transcript_12547/m.23561 type:complete len:101 (-) Transcript_12547:10-312(-)
MVSEACVNAVERILSQHESVAKSGVVSFNMGEVEIYIDENDERWISLGLDLSARQRKLEDDLNSMLRSQGYELHERGWVTKKMKSARASDQNLFSMEGQL